MNTNKIISNILGKPILKDKTSKNMLGDYDKCVFCGRRGFYTITSKGPVCDECKEEYNIED